ncbi:MAG TPA: formate dehydrogenase accessory sulfurtransferase FdhD [Thermoanaerobaculia bacterium]|jgi:FdhD protein|nr:formate dehydrogenase accessory sulfurtransferase FdhD [Thermoanaerobaculia bacterium]
MPTGAQPWPTTFFLDGTRGELADPVAIEDPLEIQLAFGDASPAQLAVTLRTPGHDRELAAGLLHAEGIVESAADLVALDEAELGEVPGSRIVARLGSRRDGASTIAARPFLSTAACGLCGKASVDAVFASGFPALPVGPRLTLPLLLELPGRMAPAQELFAQTGGIHAAALFAADGELVVSREDVGRHNAVDKVVGSLLLAGRIPAGETILAVSGRIGFEIVQKALRAGVPVLAAVGAPSTLALRLAARAGMTVVGFVRPGRCNVYCGIERIAG